MPIRMNRAAATAIALSLGVALSGCAADLPNNRSLYSVKQPVVERNNYTLDLRADGSGLTFAEQQRLADWFETMGVRYGDRIAIDDPTASTAVREDVAAIAGRYGMLVSSGAPVTPGYIDPGQVRVVVTRSHAYVPGCPDWSDKTAEYGDNYTSDGFGCAVNGNIAAMIADPEHLLHGAEGTGETVVMSSTKAIETFRNQAPTGAAGLPSVSSQEGGN